MITGVLEKFEKYKELAVASVVIFLCLVLVATFPVSDIVQSVSRSIFFLIILPILYIKFILKENLAAWGWNLGNRKQGLFLSVAAFFLGLVIFYLLIRFTSFSSHYQIDSSVKTNFFLFLLYELFFLNIFFFAQEVFFKSFVLFVFRKYAYWSVIIQAGMYFLLLIVSKNFSFQTSPFMFISLLGGWLAYKTKSFFYSYIFGLLFIIILDAYIIHLVK